MDSPTCLPPPDEQPRAGAAVLLAEDNPVNQKVTIRMLERLQHRIDLVGTGLEAVEAARRASYDILLMDCQMPGMAGDDATAEFRCQEGTDRRTPMIAMPSRTMAGNRESCRAAGMDHYLPRPIQLKQLDAAMGRCNEWEGEVVALPASQITAVAAPASGASTDRLDPSILDEVLEFAGGEGETLVHDLIRLFFTEAPARLHALRKGVEHGDPECVTSVAHVMKGGAGILGAVRVAALCDQLERQGRCGDLHGAGAIVTELQAEVDRLPGLLQARMERPPERAESQIAPPGQAAPGITTPPASPRRAR
jgi:CheY-like chemotaxis protein